MVPIINKTAFSSISIPVPPLSVQERIVSELDLLSEVIAKKKQQLTELDNLAQAIFFDMFGNPINNEKGWEVKKLGEITSKIGSGATPKGGSSVYKETGISFIRSQNVYNASFKYEGLACIDTEAADKLKSVTLQENDVLINITGDSVARCCIVPSNVLPARVNQHVAIIRTFQNIVIPFFLNYYFINPQIQSYLWNIAEGNGSSRNAITKDMLANLTILLPPLPLQQSFADKVTAIEAQKAKIKESLTEVETLFNSRMSYWFD